MTDDRGRPEATNSGPADLERSNGAYEDDPRIAREFQRAARSRRRVRTLKYVLPVLGGLIVIGGIAATVIARAIPEGVEIAGASIEDGRVVMDDPRMSGVDSNNRPFELVAQKAMQAITGGAIDLEGIDAKVAMSDDDDATIKASAGHYDPNSQKLELSGGLDIATTSGLNVAMRSAGIDLTAGTLVSQEPILIRTADQEIRANAMKISDNGDRINFSGGVSMILKPDLQSGTLSEASADTDVPQLADAAPTLSGDQ